MTTATFTDSTGRDWTIRLNPLLVRSTEKLTGISLTRLDQDPFAALDQDPLLLCDVLLCLCEDEWKSRGLTPEGFGLLLDGDTLANAATAIQDAICFFSPPARRSSLREMLEKNRGLRTQAMVQAMAKLASPETEGRIMTALAAEAERAISRALASSSSGASETEKSAG